jgi:hypothetical protein
MKMMKNAIKQAGESKMAKKTTAKKMGMKTPKPMVAKNKPTNDKVKGGMKAGKMRPFA